MNESEDKNKDIIEEDEHISMTVFYHAKKEGCDDDEAERVARAIGEIRYRSNSAKFRRWCLRRIKSIGAVLATIITSGCVILAEEILEVIKNFF